MKRIVGVFAVIVLAACAGALLWPRHPLPVHVPTDVMRAMTDARAALESAALLGAGQPLATRFDDIDGERARAESLLRAGRFSEAKAAFERVVSECSSLASLEAERQGALAAKQAAVEARASMRSARSAGETSELRAVAQRLFAVAQDRFNNGGFADARRRWDEVRALCSGVTDPAEVRISPDEPMVPVVPVVRVKVPPVDAGQAEVVEVRVVRPPLGPFTGVYANRNPDAMRKALALYGGSSESERAVAKALSWLVSEQERDGRWDSKKWGAVSNVDAGVTGLAVLAFMARGTTDRSGEGNGAVAKALAWLEKKGSKGTWGETFYTQGICTAAMCEAYALTKDERWRAAAEKALRFSCGNQNPSGGWDYQGSNPQRVDTSVSSWVAMGLASGIKAGLDVPAESVSQVRRWLKESVNANGTTGYTKIIGGQGSEGGISMPALTAAATLGRYFMEDTPDPKLMRASLGFVENSGVIANNVYLMYYGSLCMFQAGGEYWTVWNKNCRDVLVARQVTVRGQDLDGSWNAADDILGQHGGRIYVTTMATLCLETYYRYTRIRE